MSSEKYLAYRGDIQAIEGFGSTLYLAARHPEDQPVGLWVLDMDKISLRQIALDCGTTTLAVEKGRAWVAGDDGRLYNCPAKGKPAITGPALDEPAKALALLSENRLAVLAGDEVLILSRKDGATLQTLGLPEPGTALAADESGLWLVAGTAGGTVSVFECEEKDAFALSESAKIHQGAVTALAFEPGELRFISAGTDQGLFITYARGTLEPEDRARGAGHSDRVHALISGPARFYSGGADKCLRAWPRPGNARPVTLKDGMGPVMALAPITLEKHPHIVAACKDNSLRCYPLDEEGRFGELAFRVRDAYAQADHDGKQSDPAVREKALRTLAGYNDGRSLSIIAGRITKETDPAIQKMAAGLLGDSGHPRAVALLEKALKHSAEAVRVEALSGLRKLKGETDLRPLYLAISTGRSDIGVMAVRALETLAPKDEDARKLLLSALNADTFAIRHAALLSLEMSGPKDGPEGNLEALTSLHPDIRRLGLIRLFQRHMTDRIPVQAALRRMSGDRDATVRHCAFLISVAARKRLADVLRFRSPNLHRHLFEIETTDVFQTEKKAKPPALPRAKKADAAKLRPGDDGPLLQAIASRSADTALSGAQGLAILGDARAFGLLLQLSREENPAMRAAVCRSLALLADPRSIRLLRSFLNEEAPEVRDAAFSALATIYGKTPLSAARAGLSASHEDVRHRGLQVLTDEIRKKKGRISEAARELLLTALNDPAGKVRSETFKAVLNLEVDGSAQAALTFVLTSRHPDIRREVLTEIMARPSAEWADELLARLMNDPDPGLRRETFDYALEKARESDLSPLDMARKSRFADIRLAALDRLIWRRTKAAQERIADALGDEDREVRLKALDALIAADAEEALAQALTSPHKDIRAGAATARARQGDPAALSPLLELVSAEEPEEKQARQQWRESVEKALEGLAELGEPDALDAVVPLLENKHGPVRMKAASALAWICRPGKDGVLQRALKHDDPSVRAVAAFGLAVCGNPVARLTMFSSKTVKTLGEIPHLAAALALDGEEATEETTEFVAPEDHLLMALGHGSQKLQGAALISLMLRELAACEDQPRRCIACLSVQAAQVRMTAADGLSAFGDPDAFSAFVSKLINDRGDAPPWQIPDEDIRDLANLITFGPPQIRGRCAWMMWHLTEEKADAWNQAWLVFAKRYGAEIGTCRKAAQKAAKRKRQTDRAYLSQLCFGAYVGLVRETGTAVRTVRMQQKALGRILKMALADAAYAGAAQPVFIQAMSDPNQPVRLQALEHLRSLGLAPADIGAEALLAGFTDLGVMGLKLLTENQSPEAADALIRDAMISRTDGLETEAAKMRLSHLPVSQVAGEALEAASEKLRAQAVGWLSEAYAEDNEAKAVLVQALNSRFRPMRVQAALSLSTHKDPRAFDALCQLLGETRTVSDPALNQAKLIDALARLGDTRAADVFMDRLEDDPAENADRDRLLRAVGQFRNPENADRLLAMMENAKWQQGACGALVAISGYDQPIEDPEDEQQDRKWLTAQHPRQDSVLAGLLAKCLVMNKPNLIRPLISSARWAESYAVNPVLAELAAYPDDPVRYQVIEAIGWRARKRSGPADALVRALEHKDADTRFLAAEALARAGRAEGITILLTAVDLMADMELRERAVAALGELADEQALDLLLRLAADEGHALQESALEAIGHMGQSDKAEEIFKLLEKYAKGTDGLAQMALNGLRWFNTPKGWNLIRERAADREWWNRDEAVQLLGYNDAPVTRDLLLEFIRTDDSYHVVSEALDAARRLWGPEAPEPDYALLQSRWPGMDADALTRVCTDGEPAEIMAALPRCATEIQKALETGLLQRSPLPTDAVAAAMQSPFPEAVRVAAHILGRAGDEADAAPVDEALALWSGKWDERRRETVAKGVTDDQDLKPITACLWQLVWAAGRVGTASDRLLTIARSWPEDVLFRPVRLGAMRSLGEFAREKKVRAFFTEAVADPDRIVRRIAAENLVRADAKAAAKAGEVLFLDRPAFDRVAARADVRGILSKGGADLHAQGVVLPHMARAGEPEPAFRIAMNPDLAEAVRLGAIETLARMADQGAEQRLAEIGASEDTDEELRKAAWRGLRRSKRARMKMAGNG